MTKRGASTSVRSLIGKRAREGSTNPAAALTAAEHALNLLPTLATEPSCDSIADLKHLLASPCRAYYTAAAVSRRRVLEEELRKPLLGLLFRLRSTLEQTIASHLERMDTEHVLNHACTKSFFGVSAKQGVSVRFALATCIPTLRCGAGCYAHDGRDRELHMIFRAALNTHLGTRYEVSNNVKRDLLISRLNNAIRYGVQAAQQDAVASENIGFARSPRIRFSHVGEMAATPAFANRLAQEVKGLDESIECVVYTRHPQAAQLDTSLFVVNFTLESATDPRRRFAPDGARIVASAWDGVLNPLAEINFLEHHVERSSSAKGEGRVCPVTMHHAELRSCDEARCDRCFVPVATSAPNDVSALGGAE